MRTPIVLSALFTLVAAMPLSSLADSIVYEHMPVAGSFFGYTPFEDAFAEADDVNLTLSSGRLTQIDVAYFVNYQYIYSGGQMHLSIYEQTGSPWTLGNLLGSASINIASKPGIDGQFRIDSVPVNINFSTPNLAIEVSFTDSTGSLVLDHNISVQNNQTSATIGSSDVSRMALLQSNPNGWSYVDEIDGVRPKTYSIDNCAFRVYATDTPSVATVPLPASLWGCAVLLAGLGISRRQRHNPIVD